MLRTAQAFIGLTVVVNTRKWNVTLTFELFDLSHDYLMDPLYFGSFLAH
jgi:hypothetical protein